MKAFPVKVLFTATAAAATLLTLPYGSNVILRPIAAAVFVIASLLYLESDDNTLLTLATGEILVIAVTESLFFAGFVVQCAVIGAAFSGGRAPAGIRDIPLFVLTCLVAGAGAVVLDSANNLLFPYLAMVAAVCAATVMVTGVSEIRERRNYAARTSGGGNP